MLFSTSSKRLSRIALAAVWSISSHSASFMVSGILDLPNNALWTFCWISRSFIRFCQRVELLLSENFSSSYFALVIFISTSTMSYLRAIVISKVFYDVEGRSIATTTEHTKTKRASNLKQSFLMWKIGQQLQPQSILRLREPGSDTTCWGPEISASIAPTLLSGSVC